MSAPDGWEEFLPVMREVRREGYRNAGRRLLMRPVRTFPLVVRFREKGVLYAQSFSAPYIDPRELWAMEEEMERTYPPVGGRAQTRRKGPATTPVRESASRKASRRVLRSPAPSAA